MLHIGIFTDSYLPRISGVVHSVEATVRELRRRGHRVVVAAPAYPGFEDADPDVVRFPSVRPPQQRDFPLAVPLAPAPWRQLLAYELDIAHTHSPFLLGAAAFGFAWRRHVPLVFTHHTLYDQYVHYVPWVGPQLTQPAVRGYTVAYANRCNLVIAPSAAVASHLRERGVRTRIEVLPTGTVDPDEYAVLDPGWVRPVFAIPAQRPLLVTVSRLGKEKSVDLLLEAFARVIGRTEATLLVIGDGPEAPQLRALAGQLGVGDQTIFAGGQPHRKTLECLLAADVFVFASQTETLGLAVVEAMAAGLPIVAVAAGGVPDAVRDGETGFLVAPDAEPLADKIAALLANPTLRGTFGARGRQVAQQFSLPSVTARLEDLYRSLLPPRRQ